MILIQRQVYRKTSCQKQGVFHILITYHRFLLLRLQGKQDNDMRGYSQRFLDIAQICFDVKQQVESVVLKMGNTIGENYYFVI